LLTLPDDPRVREAAVRAHALADYDQVATAQEPRDERP
jgi:hypothetical protein